jgi:RimJ/RimL family protein N-acetyltransferase
MGRLNIPFRDGAFYLMIEFVEDEAVVRWVTQKMNEAGYPLTLADVGPCRALGAARDGKPLIGVVYNWFRPHHRHHNAHDVNVIIAAEPGARFRKGDVFPRFFDFAYNDMECGRITAIIAENNKRSVKLVKNLGFRKEGTIRRGYDGKTNALVYGQLRHECPYKEVVKNG